MPIPLLSDVSPAGTEKLDGVDLSVLKTDFDNHTGSSNLHVDHSAVTFSAGTGLTGGGNLTTNRTFSVTGVLEDLDTLGAPASDGQFIVATGAGAFAYESGSVARTSLGLAIGSDVQAYDGQLDDLSGLGTTKGDLTVFNGTNWVRVGVGSNDQVLTADSAQTSGVKWAAGGGGGTPGGSNTQLQYNNGGSFGGMSQWAYDDTNGGITYTGDADEVPLSLTAHSTQTSNLLEITSNGGSAGDLVVVDGDGLMGLGITSPTIQLHIKSSFAGTETGEEVFRVEDSSGTIRSFIRPGGLQTWRLNGGSGEVGQIGYTTPGGNPGIVTFTGSPGSYTNRLNWVNTGSECQFYYNDDGTSSALSLHKGGGVTVGSPTGGQKGIGTLNAEAVYDDNSLLSDYILDYALDGFVRPDEETQAQRLLANPAMLNVEDYSAFWKKNRHLPSMPSRQEWEKSSLSTGALITRLWETVELQAIHIDQLHTRIKQLGGTH